ncbi:MAG TPA: acyl carrier protein [Flavisolibacter sp.]
MKMSDQISEAIARVTREEVDIDNVRNSQDLVSELGLNSIARMKLVLELEKTFGVEIDVDQMDLSVFKTVDALENYVRQNSKVIPESN